jgi:hypothetical protein
VHGARAIRDEDSLQAELVFLKDIFKQNGYNDWQIHRTLNHHQHVGQPDNKPNSDIFLPFVRNIFYRIRRMLAPHNIKFVGLPHMKLSSALYPVKDNLGLRTSDSYRITSESGRVCIGQTGSSMDIR